MQQNKMKVAVVVLAEKLKKHFKIKFPHLLLDMMSA